MSGLLFRRLSALALLWAMFSGPALAERVHVRAASGEIGHAWLFGSEWDGAVACWLALPRHVVLAADRVTLEPFTFVDTRGWAGQSGMPIAVSDVVGAVEAAGGADDLAFALVHAGSHDCLSRLGPPDYAYGSILGGLESLDVWSLSEGSYRPLRLRPLRVQTNDGGGLMRLLPVTAEDAGFMAQGLSGAVGSVTFAGSSTPVAMVLEVTADAGEARALRFNRIRAAFAVVQAHAKAAVLSEQIAQGGVPFTIDGFTGMSTSGGPLSLEDGQCWSMVPQGGQRMIDLVLSVGALETSLQGMTLSAESCGPAGAAYIVEQKAPQALSWTPLADCVLSDAVETAPACLFDLRVPRQLRVRLVGQRAVSIGALRLF